MPCPARARLGPKTLTSRAHTWAHSAQVVPSSGAWSVVSVLDVHRTTHPLLSFLSSDPRFIIMNPRLCRQASPGTGEKARGDTKSLSEDQRITVHPKPRTLGAFAPQGGVRGFLWSPPVHLSPRWGEPSEHAHQESVPRRVSAQKSPVAGQRSSLPFVFCVPVPDLLSHCPIYVILLSSQPPHAVHYNEPRARDQAQR